MLNKKKVWQPPQVMPPHEPLYIFLMAEPPPQAEKIELSLPKLEKIQLKGTASRKKNRK